MAKLSKNWVYGIQHDGPDKSDDVDAAIYRAHQLRNRLCELEINKRERHYDLLRRLVPEYIEIERSIVSVEADLGAAREKIQAQRVLQKTKTPRNCEELVGAANKAKEKLKSLRDARKAIKSAAYARQDVIAAMAANAAQHAQEVAAAKDAANLYWGTEAVVMARCRSFSSGAPPEFLTYDGTGQLAVQLQRGLDTELADEPNTRVYLEDTDDARVKLCYFRIGSESRRPVFTRFRIVMHRPLPAGRIKWAYLQRKKIAHKSKWSLRFTVDIPTPVPAIDVDTASLVVIHTGWLSSGPDGLKYATIMRHDGTYESLYLSREHLADYDRLDGIRANRDKAFNEIRDKVADWLDSADVPQSVREIAESIRNWKSPRRMIALWRAIMAAEIDMFSSPVLCQYRHWMDTERRQWQHERRLWMRVVRRRKDTQRVIAARLARSYDIAIISSIAAKELAANTKPEELLADDPLIHRHAKQAAVCDFVQMIREKFFLRLVDADSRNMTQQCHECECVNDLRDHDWRLTRVVTCHECGYRYDADENACRNIRTRGKAMIESGALLAAVAEQQLKEKSASEKLKKMQDARRQRNDARKMATGTK